MPLRATFCAILAMMAGAFSLGAQAEEQDPLERRQLSMTLGGAIGSAGISCTPRCSADRQAGPSFFVRGTGQLAPQLNISLELVHYRQGVPNANGDGRWAMSWYLLGVQWYPDPEGAFFINVGVGLGTSRSDVTFPQTGPQPLAFSDIGGAVGIGRDVGLREGLGLTLFAQYLVMGRSQALIGRANSGANVAADLVSAGLALKFF